MKNLFLSILIATTVHIQVKVIDYYTNEELCGVKVNSEYTDFEGNVKSDNNKLNFYYPSYEPLDTIVYSNYNVIKLKQL